MTLDEIKPETFEFGVPEGTVRVEVGYPDIVGETTVDGPMIARQVRYAEVLLNGKPVREQERVLDLLERATPTT